MCGCKGHGDDQDEIQRLKNSVFNLESALAHNFDAEEVTNMISAVKKELDEWRNIARKMADADSWIAEDCGLIEDEKGVWQIKK